MTTRSTPGHSSWYRSFYWRIGLGFVACVIGVLVVQSVIFSYMMARSNGMPGRSPESFAAIIAGDIEAALGDNPALDVQAYLVRQYSRVRFPVYVVMKDGRICGSSPGPLPDRDRRAAVAALAAERVSAPPRRPSSASRRP